QDDAAQWQLFKPLANPPFFSPCRGRAAARSGSASRRSPTHATAGESYPPKPSVRPRSPTAGVTAVSSSSSPGSSSPQAIAATGYARVGPHRESKYWVARSVLHRPELVDRRLRCTLPASCRSIVGLPPGSEQSEQRACLAPAPTRPRYDGTRQRRVYVSAVAAAGNAVFGSTRVLSWFASGKRLPQTNRLSKDFCGPT